MDEPKACPFCSGQVLTVEGEGSMSWWVWCENCGATGPLALIKVDAVRCWNSRAK